MNRSFVNCAAVAALSVASATLNADLINIASNNGASTSNLGSYTGTVNYVPTGAQTATLTMMLMNTTPLSSGGYLTALALVNTWNGSGMGVNFVSSTDPDFGGLANPTSASPFGNYLGGASISSSWLGGGNPSAGLAPGQSATFVFSITAPNANALNASFFVDDPDSKYNMLVRFRGFANGGSDKVPAELIPTPGSAALMSLGLLAAGRRRR